MMLFHPQWVEIVSFLAPYLRIQAEQKQPQEPVWYWPSSYPGNRDQWRKGIPEISSPAQTLAMHWSETTFYFPSCYLKGIVDLASPWLRQLQGNLCETWGCFLCKLEERCPRPRERQGALERDCLCFCHWCHSGFFREFFSRPILYYQPDDSWVSLRPLLFFFYLKNTIPQTLQ